MESLHELRETNNSLLTTKQNETMKVFTVLAFITLPLSLIASLFNMDLVDIPLEHQPYGFWIVIAGMAVISLCMLWFFKYKKWF